MYRFPYFLKAIVQDFNIHFITFIIIWIWFFLQHKFTEKKKLNIVNDKHKKCIIPNLPFVKNQNLSITLILIVWDEQN